MLYIWDPPIRNLPKIRLISFLYEGTISQKNQPEVSYKVVSILRVLAALHMTFRSCWNSRDILTANDEFVLSQHNKAHIML